MKWAENFSLCIKENFWKMQFASYITFFCVCVANMSSSKPNIITTF